jgi:hypothetical protein
MPDEARLLAAKMQITRPIIEFLIFIRLFLVLLARFHPLKRAFGGTCRSRIVTVAAAPGRDNRHKCPDFLNIIAAGALRLENPATTPDYVKSPFYPTSFFGRASKAYDRRMNLNLK